MEASKTAVVWGHEPLTAAMLYAAQSQEQKQMLGERLYTLISWVYPDLAGKITGMMLQKDNYCLLELLINRQSLRATVEEAAAFLQKSSQVCKTSQGHLETKFWGRVSSFEFCIV